MSTSVVVTGTGVTAPNGLGTAEYWAAACSGKSGIGAIKRFDATQYPARLAACAAPSAGDGLTAWAAWAPCAPKSTSGKASAAAKRRPPMAFSFGCFWD